MLGLYAHLPFCRVHCTYCAFAVTTDLSRQEAYIDALVREIEARAGGEEVDTIYFGGGTPSRTTPGSLERVAGAIAECFQIAEGTEFTLEANPEDVTEEAIGRWGRLGVNRLSIGVQSFDDRELLPLGRVHGAAVAREALRIAAASGLRLSLDLILGLPRSAEAFLSSLDEAIATGAGHLSLYMLDLEPRSTLEVQVQRGRVALPEDDLVASLYLVAVERLAAAGLRQYEISNFARPGEESRHNLRYWRRLPYHGFGLGAHSFDGRRRFANTRNIDRYIEASIDAVELDEHLGPDETRRELLFLQLRQTAGIDYEELIRLSGEEGTEWIERGLREAWLRREGGCVAFTPSGFLLSNEYISQLF